jgi:hypothetical protein
MHPSPIAETIGPFLPKRLCFIVLLLFPTGSLAAPK